MTPDALTAVLTTHGLWLMAPLALVEGPLVTIAAAALAAKGFLDLPAVLAIATAADLAGDVLLWLAGRTLRHRIPRRLHRRIARNLPPQALRHNAGRILVFGKLTHSAGALVLLAAGMARVPFWRFLGFTLAATLPKVAALAALGWLFGTGLNGTGTGAAGTLLTALLFLVTIAAAALWLRKQGKSRCASAA